MAVEIDEPKKSAGNGHGSTNGSARQAERICGRPECGATLAKRNRSGFCQRHTHDAAGRRPATASHRHTDPERQNGHGKNGFEQKSTPSSGNGVELTLDRGDLKSDRLDHLFLSLPITEKERIACAWLTGKI